MEHAELELIKAVASSASRFGWEDGQVPLEGCKWSAGGRVKVTGDIGMLGWRDAELVGTPEALRAVGELVGTPEALRAIEKGIAQFAGKPLCNVVLSKDDEVGSFLAALSVMSGLPVGEAPELPGWKDEECPADVDEAARHEHEMDGALEDIELRVNGVRVGKGAIVSPYEVAAPKTVAPMQQARRNLSGSRPAGRKGTGGTTSTGTGALGSPDDRPRLSDLAAPTPGRGA